jgi:topoisomerase (DNA) II binding protein 1
MPPHAADADADADADASLFAGVRFALHGFDAVSESQVRTVRRAASLCAARLDSGFPADAVSFTRSQYRLDIQRCGGVHAGAWDGDGGGGGCTHVIVSGALYVSSSLLLLPSFHLRLFG